MSERMQAMVAAGFVFDPAGEQIDERGYRGIWCWPGPGLSADDAQNWLEAHRQTVRIENAPDPEADK